MDGKSLNITEEKINSLKEIIPEAFTENKIDWEKLKAALGDDIEFKNERYVLNWAGKSDAFRVLQSPATATLGIDQLTFINDKDSENKTQYHFAGTGKMILSLKNSSTNILYWSNKTKAALHIQNAVIGSKVV